MRPAYSTASPATAYCNGSGLWPSGGLVAFCWGWYDGAPLALSRNAQDECQTRKTMTRGQIYALSMPESHAFVLIHIVFSTKNRMANLNVEVRPPLHAYLATVARNAGCECYRVGGVADHVHLAVRLSRTSTIADLVRELKASSSKWLKTQSPTLAQFTWQRGYGAFSVGPTDLGALQNYIDTQDEHHRSRSFQEEYLAFLRKYGVEYDERYVWD